VAECQAPWSRWAIALHLAIVAAGGFFLAVSQSTGVRVGLAIVAGTSLFVLTGLIHEASHFLLAKRTWRNEVLGNLAGALLATPLTAYRAFHLRHHQTTNREDDPNRSLNSRWMLAVGAIVYVALINWYAWRNLRGRLFVRYLVELTAGAAITVTIVTLLPHAVRDRALLAPLAVVVVLQNIRIISEHLDLPSGKYHDTWQLVLPNWLSLWLLHYDHHLEHHLRPGLHWHELPAYRDELGRREPSLAVQRVTLGRFFTGVFLARRPRRPAQQSG
jgi:fatty acid desaturase